MNKKILTTKLKTLTIHKFMINKIKKIIKPQSIKIKIKLINMKMILLQQSVDKFIKYQKER